MIPAGIRVPILVATWLAWAAGLPYWLQLPESAPIGFGLAGLNAGILVFPWSLAYFSERKGSRDPNVLVLEIFSLLYALVTLILLTAFAPAAGVFGVVLYLQGIFLGRRNDPSSGFILLLQAFFLSWFGTILYTHEFNLILFFINAPLLLLGAIRHHGWRNFLIAFRQPQPPSRAWYRDRNFYWLSLIPTLVLVSLCLHGGLRLWSQYGHDKPIYQTNYPRQTQTPAFPSEGNLPGSLPTTDDLRRQDPQAAAYLKRVFPDGLKLSGSVGSVSDRLVMEVRLKAKRHQFRLSSGRPLLLKATNVDRFTAEGMGPTLEPVQRLHDRDDGRADGWIILQYPKGEQPTLRLNIRLLRLKLKNLGGHPILLSEPSYSLRQQDVLYQPGYGYRTPTSVAGAMTYEIVCRTPSLQRWSRLNLTLRHQDPRFLSLPNDLSLISKLEAIRKQLFLPGESAKEHLDKLKKWFQTEFDYSLKASSHTGLAGLHEFLDSRQGFCSYFAITSVALLRMQGIPARMALGFRVYEWDKNRQSYLVKAHNAHAWVEIHDEQHGWLNFDPTPTAPMTLSLQKRFQKENWSALGTPVESKAPLPPEPEIDPPLAEDKLQGYLNGPTSELPWGLVAAALMLLGVFWLWSMSRRSGFAGLSGSRKAAVEIPELVPYQRRLLRLLERHGIPVLSHRTWLELSHRTVRQLGPEWKPLYPITKTLYRIRFGGGTLAENQIRRLENWLQTLEALPKPEKKRSRP